MPSFGRQLSGYGLLREYTKEQSGRASRPKTTINNLPAYPVQRFHNGNGAFSAKILGTVLSKHRLGWAKPGRKQKKDQHNAQPASQKSV